MGNNDASLPPADVQRPTPELLRAASQSAGIFDFASDDDGDDGLDDLIAPTPPLTDEELAANFYRCPNTGDLVYRWADERMVLLPSDELADLRTDRAKLAELSWATREYDEDTEYCLCGCCRHGI